MFNDLRYALRTLLKAPGFTAVAVLTLALGIGANTAIFSVVHAVLLRPLPFPEPGRLVNVWTSTTDEVRSGHSAGDFLDLERQNVAFEALGAYRAAVFTARPGRGGPVQLEGAYVTAAFFDVLRAPAAAGRTFSRQDGGWRGPQVVLSQQAWQQLYPGAGDAAGQILRVDGQAHVVVGVLSAGAEWPEAARIWVRSEKDVPPSPLDFGERPEERDVRYFSAIARLRHGFTLEQAQHDADRVATLIHGRRGPSAVRRHLLVEPLREEIVRDVRLGLVLLQAAVGVVLLIACANVSSLLIARATRRKHELAVRAALGAGRGRLMRQALSESLVLGGFGAAAGLLAGAWLTVLMVTVLPESLPRADRVAVDVSVAAIAVLVGLVSAVLFGVLPGLQASRAQGLTAIKEGGGRGSSSRARGRQSLVIAQVALTLILLASAGLLISSFLRLQRVESGFRPERVTLVSIMLPQTRYPTGATQTALYARLIEGLSSSGEIEAVGIGFPAPLRGENVSGSFFVEGSRHADPADRPFANLASVSSGYLSALGIPLIAGRAFDESDTREAPEVAIASVALAQKYWPGESAIGRRLRFDNSPAAQWRTIVGIVGDARQLGLDQPAPPILYIPYQQFPLPFTNIALRSGAPTSAVTQLVRAQLSASDPELPPGEVSTLRHVLDKSVAEPRFRTALISSFALLALTLSAVGVFGLISYGVTQRTREIGIRVALGATPRQVLASMVREGLVLSAAGIGAGVCGALVAGRTLEAFLFGIDGADPLILGGAAIVMLAVALVATYLPSRRALRVDPLVALRTD